MWGMKQMPAAHRPKNKKNMLLNQPAASQHKQAVPLAPLTKNMSSISRILKSTKKHREIASLRSQ
jgi:hypothetical protein